VSNRPGRRWYFNLGSSSSSSSLVAEAESSSSFVLIEEIFPNQSKAMNSLSILYSNASPALLSILFVLLFISLAVLSYLFFLSQKPKTFILLGLPSSGKTTLFHRLIHSKSVSTITSQTSNEGVLETHNLIDLAGHARLRSVALDHIPAANGVLLVVDSTLVSREIRPLAELFYSVFRFFYCLDHDTSKRRQEKYTSKSSLYKKRSFISDGQGKDQNRT
jgi:hypothetical protein